MCLRSAQIKSLSDGQNGIGCGITLNNLTVLILGVALAQQSGDISSESTAGDGHIGSRIDLNLTDEVTTLDFQNAAILSVQAPHINNFTAIQSKGCALHGGVLNDHLGIGGANINKVSSGNGDTNTTHDVILVVDRAAINDNVTAKCSNAAFDSYAFKGQVAEIILNLTNDLAGALAVLDGHLATNSMAEVGNGQHMTTQIQSDVAAFNINVCGDIAAQDDSATSIQSLLQFLSGVNAGFGFGGLGLGGLGLGGLGLGGIFGINCFAAGIDYDLIAANLIGCACELDHISGSKQFQSDGIANGSNSTQISNISILQGILGTGALKDDLGHAGILDLHRGALVETSRCDIVSNVGSAAALAVGQGNAVAFPQLAAGIPGYTVCCIKGNGSSGSLCVIRSLTLDVGIQRTTGIELDGTIVVLQSTGNGDGVILCNQISTGALHAVAHNGLGLAAFHNDGNSNITILGVVGSIDAGNHTGQGISTFQRCALCQCVGSIDDLCGGHLGDGSSLICCLINDFFLSLHNGSLGFFCFCGSFGFLSFSRSFRFFHFRNHRGGFFSDYCLFAFQSGSHSGHDITECQTQSQQKR